MWGAWHYRITNKKVAIPYCFFIHKKYIPLIIFFGRRAREHCYLRPTDIGKINVGTAQCLLHQQYFSDNYFSELSEKNTSQK